MAAEPTSGSPSVAPGTLFGGRFEVQALLRQEGGSSVYRAVEKPAGSPVALRLVPLAALGPAATQLEADVENARAIVHKNLVIILDVGHQGDYLWIAGELVDGQTLRELVDAKRAEGRTLTLKGAYNVAAHAANAMAEAHKTGVHGGLNPANVWVNKAGRVKVADLGLVRALPALARRGGPPGAAETLYVAPEVSAGAKPTAASDVYALGAILYELLTGRPPVQPMRPPSEVAPEVPAAMDDVIAQALVRAPQQRTASATQFKEALAAAMAAPVPTPVPPLPTLQISPPGATMSPGPPPTPEPGRPSGRVFNVAELAGAAAGDKQERWLVRKDKLDFGPFSMDQIRAQIEKGDIKSEHIIIDIDTGAGKRIRDWAPLKELAKAAERRLEAMRRAQAEQTHEKVEKKKSQATWLVVGGAVAVVAVVGGLFVLTRSSAREEKLAARESAADVDAFLKNVKFDFSAVSVAKRSAPAGGARHAGPARGGGGDEFNMDQTLGDVSQGGGDETLDEGVIQRVMTQNYRSLVPCIMEERRRNAGLSTIQLEFVIRGNGKVSAVKVNGQKGGPFPSCVLGRMQSFGFPHFNGAKTVAGWSMRMS